MATEIERKFLLLNDTWKADVEKAVDIAQAYLCKDADRTVRIRLYGDEAFVTIKGKAPDDRPLDQPEFEYKISVEDAKQMMAMCLPGKIEKTRHYVRHEGNLFEIDIFKGENAGLVMAEIELPSANHPFTHPSWLGEEVTFDKRYKNAALVDDPFTQWKAAEKKPGFKP